MEEDLPTVSVLVASYNQGAFIAEALESVFGQTYPAFEVLVVDDGSEDNTSEIVAQFVRNYPDRLNYCTHEGNRNKGIVETYQLGLARASGQYLAFLEADDFWSKDYLAEKVKVLEAFPQVGVVFSPCRILRQGWFGGDMAVRQQVLYRLIPRRRPFDNFKLLLRKNNIGTFSAVVLRTLLARSVEVPPISHLVFFDWWLLVHLSMETSFYFDDRSHIYWRQHQSSLMGRQRFAIHQQRLTSYMEIMYASIEARESSLDVQKLRDFQAMQKKLPEFQAFYREANLGTFFRLLASDWLWALESAASYVVNRWKFTRL